MGISIQINGETAEEVLSLGHAFFMAARVSNAPVAVVTVDSETTSTGAVGNTGAAEATAATTVSAKRRRSSAQPQVAPSNSGSDSSGLPPSPGDVPSAPTATVEPAPAQGEQTGVVQSAEPAAAPALTDAQPTLSLDEVRAKVITRVRSDAQFRARFEGKLAELGITALSQADQSQLQIINDLAEAA